MKYCVKCGNELMDEAILCPKCGCMINTTSSIAQEKAKPQKPKDPRALVDIFNFVFIILAIIAFAFLAMSLAAAWVDTDSSLNYSTYKQDFYIYSYSRFFIEGVFAIFALLSSIISTAFAVISFILTLVKRFNMSTVLSAIARCFLGIALMLVSIFFLVY